MDYLDERPIRVMRIIARMNVGGPAVQISGLMKGMTGPEYEHRLYTGFVEDNESDFLQTVAPEVDAIRIKGLGRSINIFSDLVALRFLIKEIRNFKPHIVHTHTAKAGALGRLASLLSMQNVILVHTFHGHLLEGYFGSFKKSLVVSVEKALASITDCLLAVGVKVREDLLDAGIGKMEKFELMPPGLSIGSLPDSLFSRKLLGLNENAIYCAFIGRVTKIKRPDRFLEVAQETKRRGLNLEYFIAGDGDMMDFCRKKIDEESLPVKLLGWQSDVEKLLSATDIVLLTSDNEGTPLCLIQAGLGFKPVVATNVGSVPDVVLNNKTGFVTQLDVISIADSLELLVKNSTLREEFGAAGQIFANDNFSLAKLINNHSDLYIKLISKNKASRQG